MIIFRKSDQEYVVIESKSKDHVGYIRKDGFHMVRNLKRSVILSSSDLRLIELKLEEYYRYGNKPPKCEVCGGTPLFPKQVDDPETPGARKTCEHPFHPSQIRDK